MADIADVMDMLQLLAVGAVYTNGTSATGRRINIGQGWPMPNDVDNAVKAGASLVSIYAVPGTTSDPGQVMNWDVGIVAGPAPGMTADVTPSGFTLNGTPATGEYATVMIDGARAYSYAALAGDLAEGICAGLIPQIQADYPSSSRAGNAITIVGAHDIAVQVGSPATTGLNVHRQRQQFRIVIWSPSPSDRSAVARAIDAAIKSIIVIPLADTTKMMVTYQGTNLDDNPETRGVFRRDLLFNVVWDTVVQIPAFQVTSALGGPLLTVTPPSP